MRERLRVVVRGAVQGVGFRPFVYRLARELELDGWVRNSPQGVFIEVEGPPPRLEACLVRLEREGPPHAVIQSLEPSWLDPVGYAGFDIRDSAIDGAATALVLPDIATCASCRAEVLAPSNRRFRYPFTNCTHCGPRFSILEALPYDRANTSMRAFPMCPACRREYDDPADRRFHAQPNACPVCGPQLALWDPAGVEIARGDAALDLTTAAIRGGRIVAVKGLGGFHLLVDASNAAAVRRLRLRKHREEKPFALLCASLADARRLCHVSPVEARLLTSAESPIVLLARRDALEADVAAAVAPGNPALGVMLPYTPLHLLLADGVGRPVVATSGNVSDEPICTDEREALERLGCVADLFLVHDRPIVRHVDDSVVRVILGRELVLRRARGYAPLPIPLRDAGLPAIAVGGHMKNTVAVTAGSDAFLSQHIGDLASQPSTEAFLAVVTSLQTLFDVRPAFVAADSHPDYLSTRYAAALGLPVIHVQHHHAHVAACAAENELDGPVLGVAWDGTGYGRDGTIWGGEFLRTHHAGFSRTACLRPFRLPGGERAVREPRRTALGLLYAMLGTAVTATPGAPLGTFGPDERTVLVQMLERGLNAPVTSSTGRLFDGVAALLGLCERSTFEGQAAMAIEHAADPTVRGGYPFAIDDRPARFAPRDGAWEVPDLVVDWAPMVHAILRDLRAATPSGTIAARFHDTLADMIVAVAVRVGEPRVVLTGGCFQNRLLTERAVHGLRDAGFSPYWHQRVPPNDGGLALGQIAASRRIATATRVGRTELAGARAGASA